MCFNCWQSSTVLPEVIVTLLLVNQLSSISSHPAHPFLLRVPLCFKASELPLEELLALYGYEVPGQLLQPGRDGCHLPHITLDKVSNAWGGGGAPVSCFCSEGRACDKPATGRFPGSLFFSTFLTEVP